MNHSAPEQIARWLQEQLFDAIPMGVAVVDRDHTIIHANRAFEEMFGVWQGRKCYAVRKGRSEVCNQCMDFETFQDGQPRRSEVLGQNREGRAARYMKHTLPIRDGDQNISYLLELYTDITETDKILKEYQLLFDEVPCNILLIDRDYRIVKTNARTRRMVGEIVGGYCFQGLKGFDHKCNECTARQTFEDGKMHTGHHIWRTRDGRTIHLHVITVPLRHFNDRFDMVMEMAVDVTQTLQLQDGLNFAHTFLETMVATAMDGILAVDQQGQVTIFNPAARRLFGLETGRRVSKQDLARMLPAEAMTLVEEKEHQVYLPDSTINTVEGRQVPVRLAGNQLRMDGKALGMAFSIQDLSELKQLHSEKLEAERMAAVGQTVAGLAHGVKNLITALEGGMYMLQTGLDKSNVGRVRKGMEMLERNIERISVFVQAFLGFAKGRQIKVQLNDPAEIAREVVSMYSAKAKANGVILRHERLGEIAPAPIEYESLHQCLTNLVANAIDACQMSEGGQTFYVTLRTFETDGVICYEVIDNGCGMDYEIKKKVFSTFFTTKGLGGTGLGLLMTKKIIQEHGGSIDYESEPGQGTTFRIRLPRARLPKIADGTETNA
ncbi:MAG: PAS domain S-box protein [Desulfobacteraceae bacterium]|nr:PAS domain S-box protein [Desulfobacteraceae bacterium]